MRKFLNDENGFIEHQQWSPHCWVNVECPDQSDIRFMLDDLSVPPSFLESISDMDERPRIEKEGEWKLTIIRIPLHCQDGDTPYITVPLGIITNNEVVITVCYKFTELIPDFIAHTRCRGIQISRESDFILRLIYSSTFWYLKYLKDISISLKTATKQLERSIRNKDLLSLMKIQETLVFFNTSIRGNEMIIGRIQRLYRDEFDHDLLEDVEIELRQADNTVNIYTDILDSTMDSFASIISNNVNDIMKKMTGVSIVLMIPTLIASFYGMNVEITYGNNPFAFWLILFGSFTLSFILYIVLKKLRWL